MTGRSGNRQPGILIRAATKADARDLAELINLAGERLPEFQWRAAAGADQAPLEYGALRAARDEGEFSYRNARIAEIDGRLAGMLLGYRQPDPYPVGDLAALAPVLRPLVELESLAPGSWYLNAVATYAACRGRGIGGALLGEADRLARASGARRVSLIVASENRGAAALYARLGYVEAARRPLVPFPDGPQVGDWVLMLRSLD